MASSEIPYLDITIIVMLLYFIYRGYRRGFTDEFFRILGTLLGLLIAIRYMSNLANPIIEGSQISPIVATLLSFTVLFIGLLIVFNFLKKKIKKVVSVSVALGQFDKITGGTLGLFKGAIIISVFTMVLSVFTFAPAIKGHIDKSFLFNPMRSIAPAVYDVVKIILPNSKSFLSEINDSINKIPLVNRDWKTQAFIEFYTKKK
ncbi:CvpA family protein [candidate division KSB1 bacterium]|nr:CvpA family protein [candidate division KSB1 bacterium]